ncbi:MAG: Crp/Fnr family transcriptional regulator [Candidatus Eremiobacterota bacterium]
MDITRIPLFSSLSPEDAQALEPALQLRHFNAGARIFNQGDPVRGFYMVLRGAVKIFKVSPHGNEQVLAVCLPGNTFAEAAVFMGGGYPANTEALEDSDLLFVEREPFVRQIHKDPDLGLRIMAGMALKLRRMVAMVEDLTLRDARGRIARYLLNLVPEGAAEPVMVKLPARQQLIARMLGLTAETLSRTLKTLKDEGVVESAGSGRFEIRNLQRLRESVSD